MLIDKAGLAAMLRSVAGLWQQNTSRLSEIDSRFGDGDHGVTIGKIAALMERRLDGWEDQGTKGFIDDLAMGIMGISGGSAGPLYGTLVEGLAAPLPEDTAPIDAPMLKAMLAGSRDAMFEITKARVGEKTMMDALIPAVEAAQAAPGDVKAVLEAAAAAAQAGAEATEGMVSKFGRARSYGQQTLGTQDAGAVSTALFFEGLATGLPQ